MGLGEGEEKVLDKVGELEGGPPGGGLPPEQGWRHKPEAFRKHFSQRLQDNLLGKRFLGCSKFKLDSKITDLLKVLKPSLLPALPMVTWLPR